MSIKPGELQLQSMGIAEAKQDVEYAYRLLKFAVRTANYFELGLVDMEAFGRDSVIVLKEGNAEFSDDFFVYLDNAVLVSEINVGASFGASAIALDNLFEAVRGKGNRDSASDEPIDALWTLVNGVRNAFAHGIAAPTWLVTRRNQRKLSIALQGAELTVDLSALDGRSFEYAHLGGFSN